MPRPKKLETMTLAELLEKLAEAQANVFKRIAKDAAEAASSAVVEDDEDEGEDENEDEDESEEEEDDDVDDDDEDDWRSHEKIAKRMMTKYDLGWPCLLSVDAFNRDAGRCRLHTSLLHKVDGALRRYGWILVDMREDGYIGVTRREYLLDTWMDESALV